jgi:hypothetical protein
MNMKIKNKLLGTTALVSSMIALGSGVSVAQTTVSGNLDLSYRAVSSERSGAGVSSFRGFGKETQINITNRGKLNIGMDYAAGFSLEFDGNDLQGSATNTATYQGLHNENVYLNFIQGNTTIHFGADHIQNPESHAIINPVGVGFITPFGNAVVAAGTASQGIYPTVTNSPYQAYGVGIIQSVPGFGRLSAYYAPTATDGLSGPDVGNNSSINNYESTAESSVEIGFTGDLGVKGLNLQAFHNRRDATDRTTGDVIGEGKIKGTVLSAGYNFGQVTAAVDYRKSEGGNKAAAGTTPDEIIKGRAGSLTYAATKELSLGIVYGRAKSNLTTKPVDETIQIFAIGYSLGPVALNAEYTHGDEIGGVRGVDAKEIIFKASTRF